ncbi:MAG: hypothetical protein DRH43_11215, partial [Deltaproteobacteria bacterium]
MFSGSIFKQIQPQGPIADLQRPGFQFDHHDSRIFAEAMHFRPPFTAAFSFAVFSVFFLVFSPPAHGDTFLSSKIKELVWLNCSGRSNESFERVGSILT